MNIAKIIREAREKLNLNQSQLAELVGVSPQAVQQWEAGATQPRGKRLNKIAEVLNLPPALMLFGIVPEEPGKLEGAAPAEAKWPESGGAAPASLPAKTLSANDPLINQVIEAMRRMSPEDAVRLVTISKALVGGEQIEEAAPKDRKPLLAPDLAPHPPPAFPPRRLSGDRTKVRGKTAIGR
ncbi:helix-turn-helix transcriptional regulator [Nitrosovibrio tenuis]|uniref:DNA-binding transcriptional regulator, XRE-family HTH domain n=1 Tax=Nitrosovibrio tenuis TaxID=1233 RepID=A0A1H7IFU7_9PROT|nr:helix-turn-helix transcriptional regulator [Nitrosovibrio tenuis]SEK61381.1 DNA-binding transcriptional regulator, XRE-family HTH domain [Nitrosovibrio tenuis]